MPQMGESVVEGTIVNWHKKNGDTVKKEETILEISTDKVDSEIPSPANGILVKIVAKEGDTVEVGAVIARIESQDTASKSSARNSDKEPFSDKEEISSPDPKPERPDKTFLSPVVKKIANENYIPLDEVKRIEGSGAHGRVTKTDILRYLSKGSKSGFKDTKPATEKAATDPGPQADVSIIEMDHVRKQIARHMVMSKKTAPHVTTVAEADVTDLVLYREKVKTDFEKREGIKLTYTAFFINALTAALKAFPLLNSSVDDDRIIQKKSIHIGVAVGMDDKLLVPVIRHADQLNLLGIARALADMIRRARDKQLKPGDVQDGTFSITNIGTYGNLFGTPIINQPQVGILGTGAIKKRAVVINDMIAIRSMIYLSLTYDHRIIDGLYAGRFMQNIVQRLQAFTE